MLVFNCVVRITKAGIIRPKERPKNQSPKKKKSVCIVVAVSGCGQHSVKSGNISTEVTGANITIKSLANSWFSVT